MTRIAINGLGRIGRAVLRALSERDQPAWAELAPVAVNDPAPAEQLAVLLAQDSIHGAAACEVSLPSAHELQVGRHRMHLSSFDKTADLPWSDVGGELVLECSGNLQDRAAIRAHLKAGADRVLLACPGAGDLDATAVFGVNHRILDGSEQMVSAASCTSGCLAPLLAVLHGEFGIVQGATTTLHAPMNDQPLLDTAGGADLRRIRAGSRSMVPIETRLADGIGRIVPELAGRFISHSVRLPAVSVSAMDIKLLLEKPASAEAVNAAVSRAAEGELQNILGISEQPLVSEDFVSDSRSAIVDAAETTATASGMVRLLAWFDNETGFACRMLDLAAHWSALR